MTTRRSSWEKLADSDDDADGDDGDLVAADGTSTMTVELDDAGAFDCGVCYLPLKPPIFQCIEGHAVCWTCRDKLMSTGNTRCHVCRVDIIVAGHGGGGYMRSHSLERMVESVRVPCAHAGDGCAARPVYYDRTSHRRRCSHAPRRCPYVPCDFVGPFPALRRHVFSSAHPRRHEHDLGVVRDDRIAVNERRLSELVDWMVELCNALEKKKAEAGKRDDDDIRRRMPPPRRPGDDVEDVMRYSGVSRDVAVKALAENGGDVISAFMALSESQ